MPQRVGDRIGPGDAKSQRQTYSTSRLLDDECHSIDDKEYIFRAVFVMWSVYWLITADTR